LNVKSKQLYAVIDCTA